MNEKQTSDYLATFDQRTEAVNEIRLGTGRTLDITSQEIKLLHMKWDWVAAKESVWNTKLTPQSILK